jgi:hypothetical protein
MINNFCQDLRFDFELDTSVLAEIKSTQDISDSPRMFDLNHKIDQRMVHVLDQVGLAIEHAELFYTPPGKSLPIHVDGMIIKPMAKINWVYGETGSRMRWWKPRDSTQIIEHKKTPIGTNYIGLDESEAEEVFSAEIQKTALVEAGTYHSVTNPTHAPRWCFSFILCSAADHQRVTWTQAREMLKQFVV